VPIQIDLVHLLVIVMPDIGTTEQLLVNYVNTLVRHVLDLQQVVLHVKQQNIEYLFPIVPVNLIIMILMLLVLYVTTNVETV
jgi:hypothetical protein